MPEPRGWSITARLGASVLGGLVAGALVAVMDARSALDAAGAEPPASWLALSAVVLGVVGPLAVLLGLGVGVAALVLHPEEPWTLRSWQPLLRRPEQLDERRVAVLVPLSMLAVCAWLVLTASSALRLLAAPLGAAAAGLGLATVAVGLATLFALSVAGSARLLATRPWVARTPAGLPAAVVAIAVLGALVQGILRGSTGGTDSGLRVLGVLARDELDLRAPGRVALIVLAAYAVPGALGARWSRRLVLPVLLCVAGLTAQAALHGLEARRVSLVLGRDAPLARMLLPVLRRLGDADHDRHGRLFGGGDCDDGDPSVFPGAEDVPGNGRDEDCSGADDVLVRAEAPLVAPVAPDRAQWLRSRLPHGLSVLLLTVDTLRYDLGYMGYARPISPHIDALAARSTVFEQAYALASYTGKSVGPMLIGRYPSETHRGWSHFNTYDKADLLVQERLQRAGIQTLSAQAHWYFDVKTGIGRGFDQADFSAAPRVPQMEGDRTVNGDRVTDAAIRMLGESAHLGRPFFMWVHYVDPHAEYVPHEGYDFGSKGRDRYDGEVAFTDAQVGRLLDFIAHGPLAGRLAILLTSDHGEAFGEHGIIRHGHELWEELVRVPLIVHVPGAEPRRHAQRRSAIDLVPTVLDLFGRPLPSHEDTDFLSGQSLLADVLMPPGHQVSERVVFVDMPAGPHNGARQAFIEHDLKLLAAEGAPTGLFDLRSDPGERHDLLDDADRREPVVARYKAFRRSLHTVAEKGP